MCLLCGTDWIFKYMLAQSLDSPSCSDTSSAKWPIRHPVQFQPERVLYVECNVKHSELHSVCVKMLTYRHVKYIPPYFSHLPPHQIPHDWLQPSICYAIKPKYSSYCTAYNYAIFVEQKLAYFVQLNYLASFWDIYSCEKKVSLLPHKLAWPPCY